MKISNKNQTIERKKASQEILCYLFPEEFDFFYDSISEEKDRRRGVNPMSPAYQERASLKRGAFGLPLLSESGLPIDNSAEKYCENLIEKVASEKLLKVCERIKSYTETEVNFTPDAIDKIISEAL